MDVHNNAVRVIIHGHFLKYFLDIK